jgi:hypothetical protein
LRSKIRCVPPRISSTETPGPREIGRMPIASMKRAEILHAVGLEHDVHNADRRSAGV